MPNMFDSPSPSRALVVNPAVVRRRWSDWRVDDGLAFCQPDLLNGFGDYFRIAQNSLLALPDVKAKIG